MTDKITPIRPDSTDTHEEQLELSCTLMESAVRAAIFLLDNDAEPRLASEVLKLARDRMDSTLRAKPQPPDPPAR